MEDARTDRAMKRIEDALARIEKAAGQTDSSELTRQHNRLRSQVANTVKELDQLIAQVER